MFDSIEAQALNTMLDIAFPALVILGLVSMNYKRSMAIRLITGVICVLLCAGVAYATYTQGDRLMPSGWLRPPKSAVTYALCFVYGTFVLTLMSMEPRSMKSRRERKLEVTRRR